MSSARFTVEWMKRHYLMSLCSMMAAFALILTACSTSSTPNTTTTTSSTPSVQSPAAFGLATLPGYQVSPFASSTGTYNNPDTVVVDGGHVFIGYQNTTAKDCTDKNSSTVVEYSLDGTVLKTFTVPGHSDGMRADPSTHLLWTTSCEDGNAKMVTIDPTSGTITPYTFPPAPHGGGYDDLYFLNGMAFIAASNPTLDSSGNNTKPTVDEINLSAGKVVLKPILMGNATATDTITNSKVTLTLTDPDSLSTDTNGDLVLVSQGDSEIIFIKNPGTPQQSVSRTTVGTQLDDTVWASSAQGRLLVVDGVSGRTYWVQNTFKPGTVFTEAPDDSGVAGFVGVVDLATGIVTPIAIGFVHPTGMLFVPNS